MSVNSNECRYTFSSPMASFYRIEQVNICIIMNYKQWLHDKNQQFKSEIN